MGPDGLIVHSDAFPPESLVDTLGAGDTFNAAVIYTLSNGECPPLIVMLNTALHQLGVQCHLNQWLLPFLTTTNRLHSAKL